MDWIKQYILQVTGAALIAGIVAGFISKKSSVGKVIQLMCGIFLLVTLIMPWTRLKVRDFGDFLDSISLQADAVISTGENMAREELSQIIKAKTEAYILDKAAYYGAELAVEVSVEGSELPVPVAVKISGSISPYGKKQMQKIIAEDVGISLEEQIWTG